MSKPLIIGLTGSIGMGKSTVAAMFVEHGVPLFDADADVRSMQGPDGRLLPTIEARFPGSTGPEGVKREVLGEQVFGNPEALAALEAIVHPAVAENRAAFMLEHASADMVLFDIPLLFEKGGHEAVDVVVVVSAPEEVQRERVLSRPGMTPGKFADVLALQVPDAEKRARADYVINTGTSLAETERAVGELVERLRDAMQR